MKQTSPDPTATDEQTVSRRRLLKSGAGATVTTLTAATVATPAAADETDEDDDAYREPNQGILANGLGVEGGDNRAFFDGLLANFMDVSTTPEAATLADRLSNEFNANSESWLEYGNWLIETYDRVEPMGTVTLGVDVIVTRWGRDNETVPTVLEAEYDDTDEKYDGLEWRIEEPAEPDFQVGLKNTAAEYGADDLQSFRRRFIDETEGDDHVLPDEKYKSEIAGFYTPSMLWGDESKHILQLLVGDSEGL